VLVRLVVNENEKNKHLENPGGVAVLKKFGGEGQGLPFFAFLDAKGELIVSSRRDGASNIGHPFQPEEVGWFMKMLQKAAPEMKAADSKIIEDWLRNQKR
jgi:hypothetical protein